MTTVQTLTVGQPNRIALESLTDDATGLAVTTATVTHTLRDAAGTVVTGETDRACPHDADGTYRATLPADLAITVGRAYVGTYEVDIGGTVSTFTVNYRAVENLL